MEKTMRNMFLLMLCIIMSFCGNTIKNGKIISVRPAENTLADRTTADGDSKSLDMYIDRSAAKDICYISYSIETRRSGKGKSKGQEVSVVRIIRK